MAKNTPTPAAAAKTAANANAVNLMSGNIGYIKEDGNGNAAPTSNGNQYLTVFVRYINDKQVCLADANGQPILDDKGQPKPIPVQLYEEFGIVETLGLAKGDLVSFGATKLVESDFELRDGDKLHKARGYVAGSLTVAAKGRVTVATVETGEASEGLKKQFGEIAGSLAAFLGLGGK